MSLLSAFGPSVNNLSHRGKAAHWSAWAVIFLSLLLSAQTFAGWVGVGGPVGEDTRSIAFGQVDATHMWAFAGHRHYGVSRILGTYNVTASKWEWGTWEQTSLNEFRLFDPSGDGNPGVVNCVAVSGDYSGTPLVVAGTSLGSILYTTDHGVTWCTTQGLPGSQVMEILIHDCGDILACTYGDGIYKSTVSMLRDVNCKDIPAPEPPIFVPLTSPVGTNRFLDLDFAPDYSATNCKFYAVTGDIDPISGGVYYWDNGAWSEMNSGLPGWGTRVFSFAAVAVSPATVSPPDPDFIWAGDIKGGVYEYSTQSGSWARRCLDCESVGDLAVAPDYTSSNKHIAIATFWGWWDGRSSGCSHQFPKGLPISTIVHDPAWSASNPVMWLATTDGVRRAVPGGEFPQPLSGNSLSLFDISFIEPSPKASTDNLVFAASRQFGVFRSEDRGASFSQYMPPLSNASSGVNIKNAITSMAVHPSFDGTGPCGAGGSTVYMSTEGMGVFKSDAGGSRWIPTNNGLPPCTGFSSPCVCFLAYTPSEIPTSYPIYAGLCYEPLIFKLDSNTQTWQMCTALPGNTFSTKITALALTPNYNGTTGQEFYIGTDTALIRSGNMGGDWSVEVLPPGPLAPVTSIAFHPNYDGINEQRMFATVYGRGLFRKIYQTGAGWLWVEANGAAPNNLTDLNATSVVLSPTFATDNTMYVGTDNRQTIDSGGVYVSMNGGETWTQRNSGLLDTQVQTLRLVKGTTTPRLMCGTRKQKTFYTDTPQDINSPWLPSTGWKSTMGEIRAVALSPVPTNTGATGGCGAPDPTASDVFVGGTNGVFWSNDGGETFRPINNWNNLINSCSPVVNCLFAFMNPKGGPAHDQNVPMLLAGTEGSGVWFRYATFDATSISWDWTGGIWEQSDLNQTGLVVNKFTRERNFVPLVIRAATNCGAFTSHSGLVSYGENWETSGADGSTVTDIRNGKAPRTIPTGFARSEKGPGPDAPSGGTAWGTVMGTGVQMGVESSFFKMPTPATIIWEVRNGSGVGELPVKANVQSVFPVTETIVLCGTSTGASQKGVWRTEDAGVSVWEPSWVGLESTSGDVKDFFESEVEVEPVSNYDELVAINGSAGNGGIFLSGDVGRHWVNISDGFDPSHQTISAIISDGGYPPTYYAGTYSNGSYATTLQALAFPTVDTSGLNVTSGTSLGGTTVTITGTNFRCSCPSGYGTESNPCSGQTQAVAVFGGQDATTTSCSSTSLTVTTPPHPSGAVKVSVRNPDTRAAEWSGTFNFTEEEGGGQNFKITVTRDSNNKVKVDWENAPNGGTRQIFRSPKPDFSILLEKHSDSGITGTYTYDDSTGTNPYTYYYKVE